MDKHDDISWLGLLAMASVFLIVFLGGPVLEDMISSAKAWSKPAKVTMVILAVFGGIVLEKRFNKRDKRV